MKKTGFICTFQTFHNNGSWDVYIFNMLQIAEAVANQWVLTGTVAENVSGWSNGPKNSGISSIGWQVFTRPNDDDDE